MSALGCIIPEDKSHMVRKPLAAIPYGKLAAAAPVPVVLGVNWYESFDQPKVMPSKQEGTSYHLPNSSTEDLGQIRGGHCFCLLPMGGVKLETEVWRKFYNQQAEGACVGFGNSRAQTIMHGGILFDAFWLYDECRRKEGTFPNGEGSTVKAASEVLELEGHRVQTGTTECLRETHDGPIELTYGVKAVRWTTSVTEVLAALSRPGAEAVPFSNNWGDGYPNITWMPVPTLRRLLQEGGEAAAYQER